MVCSASNYLRLLQLSIYIYKKTVSAGIKKSEVESNVVSIKSGTIINKGEWTNVKAGRFGQKLYLTVNSITNSKVVPPDNNIMINNISIYFGMLTKD